DPQATVGQVNSALATIGGGIVTMRPNSPFITIAIPPPPSIDHLPGLAQTLGALAGIRFALVAQESQPDLFPFDPSDQSAFDSISHLVPTYFPAAWNAKRLLQSCQSGPLPVLVADSFAASPSVVPDLNFAQQIPHFKLPDPPGNPTNTPTH